MKSFTKLAVLLLTLALLCTSVFAVTALAAEEEAGTVSTTSSEVSSSTMAASSSEGGATKGSATMNTSTPNGYAPRYGENSYRDAKWYGNSDYTDRLISVTNRVPTEDELTAIATTTKGTNAALQYTLYSRSADLVQVSSAPQYFIYDLEVGTDNHFFHSSADKGVATLIIGGSKDTTSTGTPVGRSLYFYEGTDGIARIGTSANSGALGVIGTVGENGVSARLTFVLEYNSTDVANSYIYVYINGVYSGKTTLNVTTMVSGPSMRLNINTDTNTADSQSMWLDNASMAVVSSGSSATVAGDLAALCDAADLGIPVAIDQSHLFTLDETALVSDADTVAVKVAVDTLPETYAAYETADVRGVFNLGIDVTLTLLEDLTVTQVQDYDSSKAGAYAGFSSITEVGTKTFNLNGHTFSHLPLSYGPNYDESLGADAAENAALPGRGETFQFGVVDIEFVINGADAEGNNGKIVKVSSANALFKQNNDNVTYTNLVVSDVDFDITGSAIFGRRTVSAFDASFTDCSFAFTGAVGYGNNNTDYDNWDVTNTTPSLGANGPSAEQIENFTFTDCDVPYLTCADANVTVTGGYIQLGDCSSSTIVTTDASTHLGNKAEFTNSAITVNGGAFYNSGNNVLTGTALTLNGVTKSAYPEAAETDPAFINYIQLTDSTLTVKDSALTHGSFTLLWSDSECTFENTDIILTTTFIHVRKDIDADGTHGDNYDDRADEGYADNIGSSSTVHFKNCRFSNGNEKANALVGTYYQNTTIDVGCKATELYTLTGQAFNVVADHYVGANTGDDAADYPYAITEFNYAALAPVANLTLYSDIQYNLYLPYETTGNYIATVNGTALADLETVTDAEGNIIYYLVPVTVAAHAANEDITFTFTPVNKGQAKYSLSKSVSIPAYIESVYGNADYSDSYTLMSDLVDYVAATMTYVDANADVSAFTALQANANYTANSNEAIAGATVDYSALTTYIKGAYLNVEDSNTKFVFVAGTAENVTLSYTSLTEGEVSVTYTNCTENQALVLEMRAYDLNEVISITVTDADGAEVATGTYDLAAYANSDDAENAGDVLVAMYNYAKSAKAYKEALLAAENN